MTYIRSLRALTTLILVSTLIGCTDYSNHYFNKENEFDNLIQVLAGNPVLFDARDSCFEGKIKSLSVNRIQNCIIGIPENLKDSLINLFLTSETSSVFIKPYGYKFQIGAEKHPLTTDFHYLVYKTGELNVTIYSNEFYLEHLSENWFYLKTTSDRF